MTQSTICLCLFKVMFYGFYHGKSPLNHNLGNMFYFPTTLSKSKFEKKWKTWAKTKRCWISWQGFVNLAKDVVHNSWTSWNKPNKSTGNCFSSGIFWGCWLPKCCRSRTLMTHGKSRCSSFCSWKIPWKSGVWTVKPIPCPDAMLHVWNVYPQSGLINHWW